MTRSFRSILCRVAGCLAVTALAASAAFAAFPDRPVKLVVPFAPGGGTDAIARALGLGMSQALGQPVIVDNKPGAGTIIGSDAVAKSAPDGYSVLVSTFAHAVNPSLMPKLPYDTQKAFAPVVLLARGPNVLVVRADSPYRSVADVAAAAHAKPGKLTFASQGNGTSAHLAGELFTNLAKVQMTHIPYKGAGPALTDLLGGQVDMMFATAAAVSSQLAGGKLRAIGVTTPRRAPALKDVPAIAETVPGYAVESWYGLFVAAGTPADVVAKLNAAARKATESAEFRKMLEPEGLTVSGGAPTELDDFVRSETVRWSRIVKENNVKAD
ncbi:tripartite tricarboxylate transporter substrate binding protein [Variovorax ginsengisoli]|uniref:Tripartite tricarboxylate transporter substrate binding protein n=1 Tax=Variovorax ginsengisoli TaxID=363844 RepID=A0ABT8S2P3_9BURK|nr:tripartite tricarboxylate transporter substrate binding protein [Variovorax ginsengisoli]MDN8613603.1 tripartite tricarboxylate transporter substrate binding protein [Variovorax ginsengisoli]MDO1532773.1 tripartite tricarboxylate transporter substrate binding protein [Variovorax ginsengisoli]